MKQIPFWFIILVMLVTPILVLVVFGGDECSNEVGANNPGICGRRGEPGPIGPPPLGAVGFGAGVPNPYDATGMDNPHFPPCYPHPNTGEVICQDGVTVVIGPNNTIIPLVGDKIDFYNIHNKTEPLLEIILNDGTVLRLG